MPPVTPANAATGRDAGIQSLLGAKPITAAVPPEIQAIMDRMSQVTGTIGATSNVTPEEVALVQAFQQSQGGGAGSLAPGVDPSTGVAPAGGASVLPAENLPGAPGSPFDLTGMLAGTLDGRDTPDLAPRPTQGPAGAAAGFGGSAGSTATGVDPNVAASGGSALPVIVGETAGPIDDAQLRATLAAIQESTVRQAANANKQAASSAFGSGAAGTSVQAAGQSAVGDVLAQSGARQEQAALDFFLGQGQTDLAREQARQQGLFGSEDRSLAREGQAFDQGLQQTALEQQLLEGLLGAGALPRELEQENLDAINQIIAGFQGDPIQLLTQLISAIPVK